MVKDFKKLRQQINYYQKKMVLVQKALEDKPEDWGLYQSEFNNEVDAFFKKILDYERTHTKESSRVQKLKKFFIKHFKKHFYHGYYSKWAIDKPLGYSGDFKIIDDIYLNNPRTSGYERLFDNYFQMSAISDAVRNRKEELKKRLKNYISGSNGSPVQVLNLACGSAREIKELLDEDRGLLGKAIFDCVDIEIKALHYARNLLKGYSNINLIRENILRLAISRDVSKFFKKKYDVVYSLGLFDYLNQKTSVKLIKNIKELLNDDGILFIANVRDRYYNPSVFYMEWAGEWDLLYKDDKSFKSLFADAGFIDSKIRRFHEQQGILQYIEARK